MLAMLSDRASFGKGPLGQALGSDGRTAPVKGVTIINELPRRKRTGYRSAKTI